MSPKTTRKVHRIQELPLPETLPCPFCGKAVTPYLLADYGMIRCDRCGLKMQRKEGLRTVVEYWNKRSN